MSHFLQPAKRTEKLKNFIYINYFTSCEFSTISGKMFHSKSDHLIQFYILEDRIMPSPPCKSNTYRGSFKNFDTNKLKENFYKAGWSKVIHENDNNINNPFNRFYKTFP